MSNNLVHDFKLTALLSAQGADNHFLVPGCHSSGANTQSLC